MTADRRLIERVKPKDCILRGYDLRMDNYPDRTDAEWLKIIRGAMVNGPLPERRMAKVNRQGVDLVYDELNTVTDPGQESYAAMTAALYVAPATWVNGAWYKQALGTSVVTSLHTQRTLSAEIFRKAISDGPLVSSGRTINCLTLFNALDFSSAQTTVVSSTSASSFTVSLINPTTTGFNVGDYIRIGMPLGYEYRTILTIVGSVITIDAPLVQGAPAALTTVDQMIQEAGLFGDIPASYTTGTIAVTNGLSTVTLSGGSWANVMANGDLIRVATDRQWYTVSALTTTTLTLTAFNGGPATYQGTTNAAAAYFIRGSMYNRGALLNYVKLPSRGFAFENQWTYGG